MADYKRPLEGFRFNYGGLKTNSSPDSLAPDKYSIGQNIRSLTNNSVRTRPGSTALFSTGGHPITDIRSYAALNTDNLPRFLARDSVDGIYLDTGILIATLAGSPHPLGAAMIPFRPNASPVPYIYAANGADYQKFSAPSATNVVTVSKAGIAEPQSAPDACPDQFNVFAFIQAAAGWTQGGTAGAPSDITRSTDSAGFFLADPASVAPSLSTRYTMQVATNVQYQVGEVIVVNTFPAGSVSMVVQDVLPPVSTRTLLIQSIFYFAGSTGRCVIIPTQMPINNTVPQFQGENPIGGSINSQELVSSLRRGSMIRLNAGAPRDEQAFVWSVTQGPSGLIAIETSTISSHVAGETIGGVPAVSVSFTQDFHSMVGQAINATGVQTVVAAGVGFLTETITPAQNPFINQPSVADPSLPTAQQDDYIHFSVNISDLTLLAGIRILFDVNNGAADFVTNAFYYDVQPSDLVGAVANTQTQLAATQLAQQRQAIRAQLFPRGIPEVNPLGSRDVLPVDNPLPVDSSGSSGQESTLGVSQWSEIMFPIVALSRIGNDQTRTLANVQAVRVQVQGTGNITAQFSSMWVSSGGQPDVGDLGALYFYRVVPRSSVTGAKGNPSPSTRYGVAPRRQRVIVPLPSASYDSQIDTWDVERYGGSVLSFRYIGSAASSATAFVDNYFDDAALAGDLIEFDNFEPWPSIDAPQKLTATVVGGTVAQVTIPSPTNALRWLPGTQVQLAGTQVFTLRDRPKLISGTNYLFEFIECAPLGTNVAVSIPEPVLGNQPLPYMWGPDVNGTVFACGDPLRLGTLYFCKNNNPDSAPDTYNQEICASSEPLLGGEVIDGLSYVASPERWWALYPNVTNPAQRYSVIQQPIPRGLAAPYGHCTDGQSLFFWAKDGIWSSSKGSLTDEDLYNIFPHEGVAGRVYTYGSFTIQPPDYSRAGTFRLTYCNYYLFAVYQDSSGTYRRLILDTRKNAWCVDTSNVVVSTYYHPEQQTGSLLTVGTSYPLLLIGRVDGSVHKETDGTNDGTDPIACAIAPMEWNGGDVRAGMQWGDMILDCFPAAMGSALTATPVVLGVQVSAPSIFAPNTARVQELVSLGGEITTNYLGLLCTWTDDYTKQAVATQLEIWQPSLVPKPEIRADRSTDWYDVAGGSAAFIQGFRMKADTSNVIKNVLVRDGDALALHSFTPAVQHNGEQKKAYSFNTPFIAHTVRLESQDTVPWRLWEGEVEWIVQATPELAETWAVQPTSHGISGYHHIGPRIMVAWASTATVTLTITAFDGQSPQPVTLPSTGGQFQKQLVVLTANKGLLYTYQATSANPFQLFLEDFEIPVGAWRRQDGYMIYKSLGGNVGSQARI